MSKIIIAGLIAFHLLAQVPQQDSRNTDTPNTDTHATLPVYRSVAEWEARKAHLREQILSASGLLPMPERTGLHPQIFGRIENKDYSIEKVLLETFPGYYLGGNLYRPLNKTGKHPGILTPHGHWSYGRVENGATFSGPSLGISLARQGYVSFAYDMVGYNDTIQTPHEFGSKAEQLWAWGPLGLQLWNSIRALDFIASLDDVDTAKLGVTGASGGGTQAFLLTAVDDRIQYAAPVNMVSAIMQGGDFCENQPELRLGTNNMEIAAMFAPRPMLLVSATGDWTRNVPKEEYPAIKRIYELYGKADQIEVVQFDAPHNYNKSSREAVYKFFGKHILGETDEAKFREKSVKIEMLQDMLALSGRKLPENALNYEKLYEQWKSMARKQADATADHKARAHQLSLALATEWPDRVINEAAGERVALSRAGAGDRVPGLWIPGKGAAALVVDPNGSAAARDTAKVRDLVKAGRPVLMIDAFQTGSAVAPRDRSHKFFLTFNRSDDANRVQDILTALAYLSKKGSKNIELVGIGKAGIWAEFAAAVAPVPVKLAIDLSNFSGTDQEFVDEFFIPGIQRAGGLNMAKMLTETR